MPFGCPFLRWQVFWAFMFCAVSRSLKAASDILTSAIDLTVQNLFDHASTHGVATRQDWREGFSQTGPAVHALEFCADSGTPHAWTLGEGLRPPGLRARPTMPPAGRMSLIPLRRGVEDLSGSCQRVRSASPPSIPRARATSSGRRAKQDVGEHDGAAGSL